MARSRSFILLVAGLVGCGTTAPPTQVPDPIDLCDSPHTGSDCGNCANQAACNQCFGIVETPGMNKFHDLQICVLCTGCYTACNVVSSPFVCPGTPDKGGVCDIGGPSMAACNTCLTCAQNEPCATEVTTCQNDPACLDIAGDVASKLCSVLPM